MIQQISFKYFLNIFFNKHSIKKQLPENKLRLKIWCFAII